MLSKQSAYYSPPGGGLSPPGGQDVLLSLSLCPELPVTHGITRMPRSRGSGRPGLGLPLLRDAYLLSQVFQQHQLGVEVRGAQAGWRLAAPRIGRSGGSRSHNG